MPSEIPRQSNVIVDMLGRYPRQAHCDPAQQLILESLHIHSCNGGDRIICLLDRASQVSSHIQRLSNRCASTKHCGTLLRVAVVAAGQVRARGRRQRLNVSPDSVRIEGPSLQVLGHNGFTYSSQPRTRTYATSTPRHKTHNRRHVCPAPHNTRLNPHPKSTSANPAAATSD